VLCPLFEGILSCSFIHCWTLNGVVMWIEWRDLAYFRCFSLPQGQAARSGQEGAISVGGAPLLGLDMHETPKNAYCGRNPTPAKSIDP
jgi:hypothetical protein